MKNLLLEDLPETIEIDGKSYAVNSDFKSALRTILAFEDGDLTPQEKYLVLVENLYKETPPDIEAAISKGLEFLNGGSSEEGEDGGESLRLYSFSQDGNLIFAAFRQTHGIDLSVENLHWWKFIALFLDLGAETSFVNLISLRKRLKEGTASKEEVKYYRQNKEVVDVPEVDTRTLDEKIAEQRFYKLLGKGKK